MQVKGEKQQWKYAWTLFQVPIKIFRRMILNAPWTTFACSKLTIETLEQGVKYDVNDVF